MAIPGFPGGVAAVSASEPEVVRLLRLFPSVQVTPLVRVAGTLTLDKAVSLSPDMMAGVVVDTEPPLLHNVGLPYPPQYADDCTPPAQYIAAGIEPFRFKRWSHIVSCGGYHMNDLADYLSTHGCDVVDPGPRSDADLGRLPNGSLIYRSLGFSWKTWMATHGFGAGRYDQLPDAAALATAIATDPAFNVNAFATARLMLDLEQAVYDPPTLRTQPWYPGPGISPGFESAYYTGYGSTLIAPQMVARQRGFQNLSVYGWFPMPRAWYNLQTPSLVDWSWPLMGQELYDTFDTILTSVYCFYWGQYNVQYVLCNLDYCNAHLADQPTKKDFIAYFTTLLTGSGDWWTLLPMPNEEYRAMALLSFFTGVTGTAQWNYAGAGKSIVSPRPLAVGEYFMLRDDLIVYSIPDAIPLTLHRYDAVQLSGLGDIATLRVVDRNSHIKPNPDPSWTEHGVDPAILSQHLRTSAEPIAGFVEGLAMARLLDSTLADGALMADQTRAQLLHGRSDLTLGNPIIRRRKLGNLHVICVYDPEALYGRASGRDATVTDFDGVTGLTLNVPADEQVRLYLLRDS